MAEKAGGAILSWIIEGAIKYRKNDFKLIIPKVINEFTEEYREAEDWAQNFLMECTEPGGMEGSGVLYEAYRSWAKTNGDRIRRPRDFSPALENAGLKKIRFNGRYLWKGIKLRDASSTSRDISPYCEDKGG